MNQTKEVLIVIKIGNITMFDLIIITKAFNLLLICRKYLFIYLFLSNYVTNREKILPPIILLREIIFKISYCKILKLINIYFVLVLMNLNLQI